MATQFSTAWRSSGRTKTFSLHQWFLPHIDITESHSPQFVRVKKNIILKRQTSYTQHPHTLESMPRFPTWRACCAAAGPQRNQSPDPSKGDRASRWQLGPVHVIGTSEVLPLVDGKILGVFQLDVRYL